MYWAAPDRPAARLRTHPGASAGTADITEPTLRRFSSLAGFAFALVFASGVVNASIRLTTWNELFGSAYGQLILAKTAAVLVLGGIGLMHRRWVIPQLGNRAMARSARGVLWQLVIVELIIMGATSGIAVALGRSAPPQPTTFAPDASPAFILSGYELPPELTPERWLTEWRLDWLWVAVVALWPGGLHPGRPRRCGGGATRGPGSGRSTG